MTSQCFLYQFFVNNSCRGCTKDHHNYCPDFVPIIESSRQQYDLKYIISQIKAQDVSKLRQNEVSVRRNPLSDTTHTWRGFINEIRKYNDDGVI
jgi:hypothetical protein